MISCQKTKYQANADLLREFKLSNYTHFMQMESGYLDFAAESTDFSRSDHR